MSPLPSFALAGVVVLATLAGCGRGAARNDGPDAAQKRPTASEPTLNVSLDRNGVVQFASDRLLLDDDIRHAFSVFHERAPRGKLAITAHRATLHGRLVRIVDLAKEANVPFEISIED